MLDPKIMTQRERRIYLIKALLAEYPSGGKPEIPTDAGGQQRLLRGLMNVRRPSEIGADFLAVQNEYLQTVLREKGITYLSGLTPIREGIYLWRGDITTLCCGAIVNAANSGMTGCYHPCHGCIDNCIHTYAGVQLRLKCAKIMEKQGYEEPVGRAKLTPAYNLPCEYVIHTVGPRVEGALTGRHCSLLAECYRSCLTLADRNRVGSIAFCCISTGVFGFPNDRAAEIAVNTVFNFRAKTRSETEVIFNVFTDTDERIYKRLLGAD